VCVLRSSLWLHAGQQLVVQYGCTQDSSLLYNMVAQSLGDPIYCYGLCACRGMQHTSWQLGLMQCTVLTAGLTLQPAANHLAGPAAHTVPFKNKYYTVYPERVTWAEADAFCRQTGGRLAVLDSREALNTAHQVLLTTLASQTAIRWGFATAA
jgi:hypothetical protein